MSPNLTVRLHRYLWSSDSPRDVPTSQRVAQRHTEVLANRPETYLRPSESPRDIPTVAYDTFYECIWH